MKFDGTFPGLLNYCECIRKEERFVNNVLHIYPVDLENFEFDRNS